MLRPARMLFSLLLVFSSLDGMASAPDVRSRAALVLDRADGRELFARDAGLPLPIASITKLMSAMVVLDAGQPLQQRLKITAADRIRGRGAGSRIPVGAVLTRADLLHLSLMSSENLAAQALGNNYPGGMQAMVRAMNEKARQLGMTQARFVDPAGLSAGNVASARDLARLVAAASRYPQVRQYSTAERHTVTLGRRAVEYRNTDSLVRDPGWQVVVQKTGYLDAAGRCLVLQARIQGRDVVIVLLNSFGSLTRVADARRIRRWMESRGAAVAARAGG